MSTEALDRIIAELKELTPDERRELIDRLAEADTVTLQDWVNQARYIRAELPLTSDSVNLLRELREVRSQQ